jgi:hypothetical protein
VDHVRYRWVLRTNSERIRRPHAGVPTTVTAIVSSLRHGWWGPIPWLLCGRLAARQERRERRPRLVRAIRSRLHLETVAADPAGARSGPLALGRHAIGGGRRGIHSLPGWVRPRSALGPACALATRPRERQSQVRGHGRSDLSVVGLGGQERVGAHSKLRRPTCPSEFQAPDTRIMIPRRFGSTEPRTEAGGHKRGHNGTRALAWGDTTSGCI